MPQMNEILIKLVGLHYDTSPDLDMKYDHI